MCYKKKGSGTIGNDSCIQQHSLGVFFPFTFFLTVPDNGLIDNRLQIQQEDFLLLERRRAAQHSNAPHRQCSVLFCLHMGM